MNRVHFMDNKFGISFHENGKEKRFYAISFSFFGLTISCYRLN